jgi:hypothetical protein
MCQVSLVTEVLGDLVLAQRNPLSHGRSRSRAKRVDLVLKRARRAAIPVRECNPEMERLDRFGLTCYIGTLKGF